ncbi:MAG: small multi-drug export protein [Candidatus Gracilibacteria bacterium]|jgi:uncharacterized membrane protein
MLTEKILQVLTTIGMGALPIFEVRGALSMALGLFHMNVWEAFLSAALGNILAVSLVLRFLDPASRFLMKRYPWWNTTLTRLFHKTRHEHSKKFKEFGSLFLIGIVALPLPMAGAWLGSLIAFLFGVRYWNALILLSIGILCSGALVIFGVHSVTELIEWIKA